MAKPETATATAVETAPTTDADRAARIKSDRIRAAGLISRAFTLARSLKKSVVHAGAMAEVLAQLETMAEDREWARNLQELRTCTIPEVTATENRDYKPAITFKVGIQTALSLLRDDAKLTRSGAMNPKSVWHDTI